MYDNVYDDGDDDDDDEDDDDDDDDDDNDDGEDENGDGDGGGEDDDGDDDDDDDDGDDDNDHGKDVDNDGGDHDNDNLMIMMMKKKIIMLMAMMMMVVMMMMMMTHFVRACAVEMHFNMSQEPLYTEIYRKNVPRPRISPERGHTFCASLRSRNAHQHFTRDIRRATFYGNLQEKCRAQIEPGTQTHTLCEPAQSKHMSRFYTSHFIRKFKGKMPAPRVSTLIKHRPSLLP